MPLTLGSSRMTPSHAAPVPPTGYLPRHHHQHQHRQQHKHSHHCDHHDPPEAGIRAPGPFPLLFPLLLVGEGRHPLAHPLHQNIKTMKSQQLRL